MDIRSLYAAQKYAATRKATEVGPEQVTQNAAADALNNFEISLKDAEEAAKNAMSGNADPHVLVHALAQSQLAVETAVTVRNKVVEAYQEILRMPV